MDLWSIFLFFFICFLLMSCCGYCCTKKRRGAVLSAPVVVTAATHTHTAAPRSYPVSQVPVAGTISSGYQTQIYTAPYPTQSIPPQMPMPMPMPINQTAPPPGVQPHIASGMAMLPGNMNPPPYDVAVAGSNLMPGVAAYEKQSAYNPNFSN